MQKNIFKQPNNEQKISERNVLPKTSNGVNFEEKNLARFAPLIIRIGLAIVFILFGLQKLSNPSQTTAEIQLLLNWKLSNVAALNYYLGLTEIILAAAFFIGFKIRIAAVIAGFLLILFLSSFLAKYGFSINPDLYRDVGLLGAAISLFLTGAGPWSADKRIKGNE